MLNLSRCRILAIGKVKKSWIQEGLNIYLKRLPGLTVTEIRDSTLEKESQAIKNSLNSGEHLITLQEEGEKFSSITFSQLLENLNSQQLVFIIGGPNGLSPQIKNISHHCLSLSPLTFPHELARLLLVEQLYRAKTIIQGTPYHRT